MSWWRSLAVLILASTGGGLQWAISSWWVSLLVGFPFYFAALTLMRPFPKDGSQ